MRMMLLFDLPSVTYIDRKAYNRFRKFIMKEGFIMMQESVYVKLLLNNTAAKLQSERIRENAPTKGIVELLLVTEKQFSTIEYITGSKVTTIEDSDERLVII